MEPFSTVHPSDTSTLNFSSSEKSIWWLAPSPYNYTVLHRLHIIALYLMVAHGRMVTSSRQITEVKQRRARLVLGWVTVARSSHAVGHV